MKRASIHILTNSRPQHKQNAFVFLFCVETQNNKQVFPKSLAKATKISNNDLLLSLSVQNIPKR